MFQLHSGQSNWPPLGTMPNFSDVPALPLFPSTPGPSSGLELLAAAAAHSDSNSEVAHSHFPTLPPTSKFDPATALPSKLVRRILDLEFIEMAELLPDAWIEDPREFQDTVGRRHRSRRPQVTEVTVWLEFFARMAAVLSSKYPDKAPELWAYQATVLRAAKSYKGISWVAYDRQYS